jgi:hypothetical protein
VRTSSKVERGVARHAHDPRRERHLARLVAMDRRDQLREDVVGDVLRLVGVPHDGADHAADVVRVADVQELECAAVSLLQGDDRTAHELRLRSFAAGKGRTLVSIRDGGCRLATGGH